MLKIFTTQLLGVFNKIQDQEEINFEDGARLLAQAAIADGSLYIYGAGEMGGIITEALYSQEPLPNAAPLFKDGQMAEMKPSDRVIIVSRFSHDPETVALAKTLAESGIPTVSIAAVSKTEEGESLENITDVHIDTKLLKPLIPDDDGSRYGFPALLCSLYAYYGLTFILREILAEY